MTRNLVLVTLIVCTTALASWYIYLANSRFEVVGTQDGIVYELDRKTGETWTVYPGKKVRNEDPNRRSVKPLYTPLTATELAKVAGNGDLSYGSFSGKLYNGSSRTVKEVIFIVQALEEDGSERWTRKLRESLTLEPLETESFSVTVTGEKGIGSFQWSILEASGL